jgi:hypothetical protein
MYRHSDDRMERGRDICLRFAISHITITLADLQSHMLPLCDQR